MKICLVWIGRTKNRAIKALIDDYMKRLSKLTKCSIIEMKEVKNRDTNSSAMKSRESKSLLAFVRAQGNFNVVLDEAGKELTSWELSEFIAQKLSQSIKQVNFILGSFVGVTEELKREADLLLSLSRLTLTHEFARLIMIEQLYRSFAIISNLPYQK